MEILFELLLKGLVDGGSSIIFFILALIIVWLLKDRVRLINDIEEKDSRIDSVVDDYQESTANMVAAINSINLVLHEIKGKIL